MLTPLPNSLPAESADSSNHVPAHVRNVICLLEGGSGSPTVYAESSFADLTVGPTVLGSLISQLDPKRIVDLIHEGVVPVNISDFDGTLIRDSSGLFMIDYAVEQGFLLPEIRSRLNETMQRFGLEPRNERHGDDSGTIGKDVFAIRREFQSILQRDDIKMADKHELTREFYQMCSWFFAGHTRDEMHRFAERVLLETGYGANYFSQSRELINQLSAAGIQTMIISATFQPIVEVAARFFGVPDWAVVGMNLETDKQGRYTTTIKEPVTFREGKVTAANELISRHIERTGVAVYQQTWRPLLAMGDSPAKTDEHLLSMAHVAVAVEPQTPKDADIAKEWFTRGRPGFFLEYESTIGGELANRFSSRRSKQVLPQDSFL